jgi:competence protein ComEC
LAALLALGLGAVRYQVSLPVYNESFLATYNDSGTVILEGVVWDEPDVRDTRTNLRVRVETLVTFGDAGPVTRTVRGLALVYAPRFSEERLTTTGEGEFRYGDRLRVTGQLETPPEFADFSYRDYLARQGVYSQVRQARVTFVAARQGNPFWQVLFDFKTRALGVLTQIFPEPHAALLSGILLGVESGIPQDIKEAFSITGTSHIVAISGFNIAIIAGIFSALANRAFGVSRGAVIAIAGIAAYTILVGAGASVVRAAIMGSLAIVGRRLGRQGAGLNLLAAAVLGMTLVNPLTLWDVGFQLSVAATLGLMLYAEPFQTAFQNWLSRFTTPAAARRITNFFGESFLLTLAAQITTLPLIVYYFRSLSLISLVANAVILPAQPAVMMLGGLALMGGLVALPLGRLLAWLAWPFTAYTLAFVQLFARLPAASLGLADVAEWFVVGVYGLLFGLTWMLKKPPEQRPAWRKDFTSRALPVGGLAALAISVVGVWSLYFSLPDGRLRISVLDVGQGDAVLVQTPSGVNVLIDGGPSGSGIARALARELPLFTNRLNVLVIASPRDESIAGLPDVLKRYAVDRAILTGAEGRGGTYATLLDMLRDKEIETLNAADLPTLDLGDGVTLRVIADGENGCGVRIEQGEVAVVLPIGLRLADETALLMNGLAQPAAALLLADHGSNKATQEDWVWAVNPALVMVSLDSTEGGPSAQMLERLAGRTLLRTDEHGTITLMTDGAQVWVETGRR